MSQSDAMPCDDEECSEVSMEDEITTDSECRPVYVVSKPVVSTPLSILIESLVKNICMVYETDQNKASSMYKLICDKLYSMNLLGESYTMSEFEGIRSQYQRAFLHLLTSVKNGDKSLPIRTLWPKNGINSHYHREFDEVQYIAGGGFGQVYKVKHKLDGTEYAVKKIPIRSEGIQSVKNYLSEVKTFASMNHPNIVQYKGAWLEITPPSNNAIMQDHVHECDKKASTHTSTLPTYNQNTTHRISEDITASFPEDHSKGSSDFQIAFEHSISGASSRQSRLRYFKRKSLSEGSQDEEVCRVNLKDIEKIRVMYRPRVKWATLYIQMALCQLTLRQWLEKRNDVSEPEKAIIPANEHILKMDTVKQILIQLLEGLKYIHSKGVVHHDIKPSNIFTQIESSNLLVQLGDFGLACPLQNVRHSLAFGTKLYAAPEQLAGQCNPKSDMYSLGIVLFELVENFGTDMERVRCITELRKGNITSKALFNYPEIEQMISKLVIRNPNQRPDTIELLSLLRKPDSELVEQLKMQLAEKEEEILHLKELLKSHGIKSV